MGIGPSNRTIPASAARKPVIRKSHTPNQAFVRLPLLNDDMHVVGWELARLGPGLTADIRRVARDGRL
jgi:hypothetical protein